MMNSRPSYRKVTASAVVLSGLAFAVALGCTKSEAAPQPPGGRDVPAPAEAENPAAAVAAAAKFDTSEYLVEIKGTGTYSSGKEGTVDVSITPKGGYKINDQYPYKFKLVTPPPEGVSYPKPILQRADGTFEKSKGLFKVPFVAAKAGKAKIAGALSFSVCTDANCLMKKEDLELTVDVK